MTELNVYYFHPPGCSHCGEALTWIDIGRQGWECKGCGIQWEPDGSGARLTGDAGRKQTTWAEDIHALGERSEETCRSLADSCTQLIEKLEAKGATK